MKKGKISKNKKENIICCLSVLMFAVILTVGCPEFVYATNDDLSGVTSEIDKFFNLISTVVSSMGAIVSLWGISEWGLSLQGGNGGMMEAQGFKRIIGGIVMIMAPNVITLFI